MTGRREFLKLVSAAGAASVIPAAGAQDARKPYVSPTLREIEIEIQARPFRINLDLADSWNVKRELVECNSFDPLGRYERSIDELYVDRWDTYEITYSNGNRPAGFNRWFGAANGHHDLQLHSRKQEICTPATCVTIHSFDGTTSHPETLEIVAIFHHKSQEPRHARL